MKSVRQKEIDSIIAKLHEFKNDPAYAEAGYAIDENLIFLNAIRSLPRYIWWLLTRAKHIDGSRLLELTDFPVKEWDIRMHDRLITMERNKHVGLIQPLVDRIAEHITQQDRPLVLVNLGAGGMEVDRQVAARLLEAKHDKQIIFIGVDKSPTTHEIAKKNLESLGKEILLLEINGLTKNKLEEVKRNPQKIIFILCKDDIFTLDREFAPQHFDIVYHSLFKHHLTHDQQESLLHLIQKISKKSFEYDGYRSWKTIVQQTAVGWNYPVFLNAELFSNLRFKAKPQLIKIAGGSDAMVFYPNVGSYLLQHS